MWNVRTDRFVLSSRVLKYFRFLIRIKYSWEYERILKLKLRETGRGFSPTHIFPYASLV